MPNKPKKSSQENLTQMNMGIKFVKVISEGSKKPFQEHLTQKASKGVLWTLVGTTGSSLIGLGSTAILARMLAPEDFGLVGMATLVTGIVKIFGNFGLVAALVQKPNLDERDLSTGFWASFIVGIGLMLITCAVAPLASFFFGNKYVALIILCLSINFFLNALSSMSAMMLYKDLKFKITTRIGLTTTLIRVGVVLTLAAYKFGFWSIVIGMVVERMILTVWVMKIAPLRPKLLFDKERFKHIFRFGRNIYGTSLLGYLNGNTDYLVAGKMFGPAPLAIYQFAYNIPHLVVSNIAVKINEVGYPLYCKVNQELDRLQRGFLKTVSFLAIIVFPMLFGLMSVSQEFILTVYGDKWSGAIFPLRLLCISAILKSLDSINGTLLNSKGRPDLIFKWCLLTYPGTLIALLFAARYGTNGIAAGMTLLSFLTLIITHITLRMIKINYLNYLKALKPAFISSMLMMILLFCFSRIGLIRELHYGPKLIFNIICGALLYGMSIRLLFADKYNDMVVFIKQMLRK